MSESSGELAAQFLGPPAPTHPEPAGPGPDDPVAASKAEEGTGSSAGSRRPRQRRPRIGDTRPAPPPAAPPSAAPSPEPYPAGRSPELAGVVSPFDKLPTQ